MDFDSFFSLICKELEKNGEINEASKRFSACHSDKQRVSFVSQMEAVQQAVSKLKFSGMQNSDLKSAKLSTQYRTQGNAQFQKKNNRNALYLYNLSVLNAPANSKGPELSLAYANRSAVLQEMAKWRHCLRDSQLALALGYPANLHYKLYERQGNCWLKLGVEANARASFLKSKEALELAELGPDKKSKASENLQWKLDSIKGKCDDELEIWPLVDVEKLEQDIETSREKPPELNRQSNPTLPCASLSVAISQSAEKGRHLIATENLQPGTTIIVEKAFASVLLEEHKDSHCHHCLYWMIAPVACDHCTQVRFCSTLCRNSAWSSYHSTECGFNDRMYRASVGRHGLLAMRTVAKVGLGKLTAAAENNNYLSANDGVYDSTDYQNIYNLVTNSSQRTVSDLFRRTVMAVYMANVFEQSLGCSNNDTSETVACVLLRHLQNYPCNAHEISQLSIQNKECSEQYDDVSQAGDASHRFISLSLTDNVSMSEACLSEVGAAAFACLSLINHSCDPNVVRHCYGDKAVVTVIRPVNKGQEILDNYGYHYATQSIAERRSKLLNQYHFLCACQPCREQWPLYPQISQQWQLARSSGADRSAERDLKCQLQKYSTDFKIQLDELMTLSCGAETDVLRLMMSQFCRYIAFLDDHIVRPFQEYNDAQEALKQCLAFMATVYVQN